MSLSAQLETLYALKRDRSGGYEKPYKPALLLVLIDLIERGDFPDNRFTLTPELIGHYAEILRLVGGPQDHTRIAYPFWHLCGDGVWMLYGVDGKPLYESGRDGSRSPSLKWIRENMTHASLEPELFQLLSQPEDREIIRQALHARYFPTQTALLRAFLSRFFSPGHAAENPPLPNIDDNPQRSAAFAKTVKEIYDYRCAASGQRFRLDDLTIVDACHLIPFAESHNDHPTNGLALCKNHHWAMDRQIIAPAPDHRWRTSPHLDARRSTGEAELLTLEGKSLLLPKDAAFHPDEDGLSWRVGNLVA